MNKIKMEVVQKLNSIVELVKHCATEVVQTRDQQLIQEVNLAAMTHEGLCKLFEQEGITEHIVLLINDFGKAVAQLYRNIANFKQPEIVPSKPNVLNLSNSYGKKPVKYIN